MLRISSCVGTMGVASMSHLPTRILPAYSCARASTCGATARHGVHQVAQKSTKIGSGDLTTSLSKLLSVTTTMFWLAIVRLLYHSRNGRGRANRQTRLSINLDAGSS